VRLRAVPSLARFRLPDFVLRSNAFGSTKTPHRPIATESRIPPFCQTKEPLLSDARTLRSHRSDACVALETPAAFGPIEVRTTMHAPRRECSVRPRDQELRSRPRSVKKTGVLSIVKVSPGNVTIARHAWRDRPLCTRPFTGSELWSADAFSTLRGFLSAAVSTLTGSITLESSTDR